MPEIKFEENWRYRTLSKLETLFHVTNVTTVLNASVVSDRVSRYLPVGWGTGPRRGGLRDPPVGGGMEPPNR